MKNRGVLIEDTFAEGFTMRAARIVVDTSLHLGEMTFDEAVTFMTTKVPIPEPISSTRGPRCGATRSEKIQRT